MIYPLQYMGAGEFRVPRGHAARADKELVIGEVNTWEISKDRSRKSHDHFFAVVDDAWANLPENVAHEFPNPEALRKRCLITAGYCTVKKMVLRDNAEAIAACAFLQGIDRYAICEVSGSVVTIWQAESQSKKAMGPRRFQESKEAALVEMSKLVGSDVTQAGAAA